MILQEIPHNSKHTKGRITSKDKKLTLFYLEGNIKALSRDARNIPTINHCCGYKCYRFESFALFRFKTPAKEMFIIQFWFMPLHQGW